MKNFIRRKIVAKQNNKNIIKLGNLLIYDEHLRLSKSMGITTNEKLINKNKFLQKNPLIIIVIFIIM